MADRANRSNTPAVVVVVAIVGLLSTISAAALGGYWTNRSVERQFESQRTAAIQDQRRAVYVDYLRATTQACEAAAVNPEGSKALKAVLELLNQQGRVSLIGSPNVRNAVAKFTEAVLHGDACDDENKYAVVRDVFVTSARPDLE